MVKFLLLLLGIIFLVVGIRGNLGSLLGAFLTPENMAEQTP